MTVEAPIATGAAPPAQTTSAATATTTTAVTTTGTTTGGASTQGAPAAVPFVRQTAFQSPTGNIGCMIVGGEARCDIVRRDWSPPQRPAACPNIVDFGQGLTVGSSGPGRFVCAGDTVREPSAPRLPYGTASVVGSFTCVSRETGVECTNTHTGHGFTLSVQGYSLR